MTIDHNAEVGHVHQVMILETHEVLPRGPPSMEQISCLLFPQVLWEMHYSSGIRNSQEPTKSFLRNEVRLNIQQSHPTGMTLSSITTPSSPLNLEQVAQMLEDSEGRGLP